MKNVRGSFLLISENAVQFIFNGGAGLSGKPNCAFVALRKNRLRGKEGVSVAVSSRDSLGQKIVDACVVFSHPLHGAPVQDPPVFSAR
jgi:hypothetical protein